MFYSRKLKNKKVYYNGMEFDSQLELQFALHIEDDFVYSAHSKTFFEREISSERLILTENAKSYNPDFFIRSITKNKAYYIEIKPDAKFENRRGIRSKIMTENLNFKRDIEFLWIYEKSFSLSASKKDKLEKVLGNQQSEHRLFNQLLFNYGKTMVNYPFIHGSWSQDEYRKFLHHGTYPENSERFVESTNTATI